MSTEAPPRDEPAETSGDERVSVLVADDDLPIREALAELVGEDERFELVGLAVDADEAIALAARERPRVALLDVKMPAGGGPRAAREIRQRSPSTHVVALSAYDDRATVLEMSAPGRSGTS